MGRWGRGKKPYPAQNRTRLFDFFLRAGLHLTSSIAARLLNLYFHSTSLSALRTSAKPSDIEHSPVSIAQLPMRMVPCRTLCTPSVMLQSPFWISRSPSQASRLSAGLSSGRSTFNPAAMSQAPSLQSDEPSQHRFVPAVIKPL